MLTPTFRKALLVQRFGPEWESLTAFQRQLVGEDFRLMLAEEYDVGDETMSDGIEKENAEAGSIEYRRRIGGGNLASYARTLEAGEAHKAKQ